MDPSSSWIPIAISGAAVAISVVALWRTHFARFRLAAVVGDLTVSVYPIRSEGERWFIYSLEAPITLANAGTRPGRVLGLRANVTFPKLKIRRQRCLLGASFVVTNSAPDLREQGRFTWLDTATQDWTPHLLLSRETSTQTVLFERRFDEPIVDDINVVVEAFTRPRAWYRRWQALGKWDVILSESIVSDMIMRRSGGGHSYPSNDAPEVDEWRTRPRDLLRHVSHGGELTPKLLGEPSYLDYDDDGTGKGKGKGKQRNRKSLT